MIKDSNIESNKYEPVCSAQVNNIHVVVMANFLPDYRNINEDRVVIIYCNDAINAAHELK
jgi:hypothetical protein